MSNYSSFLHFNLADRKSSLKKVSESELPYCSPVWKRSPFCLINSVNFYLDMSSVMDSCRHLANI